MKYACNYLTEVVDLLKNNKIELDYIKYPSVSDTKLEELKYVNDVTNKDILFHGTMTYSNTVPDILSSQFIEDVNIEETKEAIRISNTPGLSLHLGNDCYGKDYKELSKKELLNTLYKNVDFLKTNFTNNLEFLEIENRQQAHNLETLTPQFITEAMEVADCKFLLDISHAASAASLLDMDYMKYIKELPLNRINETHLNGWRFENSFLSHIEMNEEGYNVLDYIVKNTGVDIVTLEYGISEDMLNFVSDIEEDKRRDVPVIEIGKINTFAKEQIVRQLNRIREICEK